MYDAWAQTTQILWTNNIADSGGAAREQPADTDHSGRRGSAGRSERVCGKGGLSAGHSERLYARSTVKCGWLVSAEWREEEDGERQLRMETIPYLPTFGRAR